MPSVPWGSGARRSRPAPHRQRVRRLAAERLKEERLLGRRLLTYGWNEYGNLSWTALTLFGMANSVYEYAPPPALRHHTNDRSWVVGRESSRNDPSDRGQAPSTNFIEGIF